jgi:hypothetical protein
VNLHDRRRKLFPACAGDLGNDAIIVSNRPRRAKHDTGELRRPEFSALVHGRPLRDQRVEAPYLALHAPPTLI